MVVSWQTSCQLCLKSAVVRGGKVFANMQAVFRDCRKVLQWVVRGNVIFLWAGNCVAVELE